MNLLYTIWNRISFIGIDKDVSDTTGKNVILTNQFAFTWMLLIIPYIIIFLHQDLLGVFFLSGLIVMHIGVLILNKKGYFNISRLLEATVPQVVIFLLGVFLFTKPGEDLKGSFYMLNLSFWAIPFMVFSLREIRFIIVSIIVSSACYFFFDQANEWLHFSASGPVYMKKSFETFNYFIAAGLITIGFVYVKSVAVHYQRKTNCLLADTENRNKALEDHKNQIEAKNQVIRQKNDELQQSIEGINHLYKILRENEERLRNIYDSIGDGIVITDSKGVILEVNPVVSEKTGYDKDDLFNQMIDKLFAFKNDSFKTYIKAVQSGTSHLVETHYLINPDIPVELKGRVIPYGGGMAVLHLVNDISERKRLQKEVMRAVMDTEDKERKRFAQDIHDSIGALMSSIKMHLNVLNLKVQDDEPKKIIDAMKDLLSQAIESTRNVAYDIMPAQLGRFGLVATIQSFIRKIDGFNNIRINFEADHFHAKLDKDQEVVFYRVVCELINNTLKHANASNIYIELSSNTQQMQLFYTDDGIGFDFDEMLRKQEEGLGLNNIVNRLEMIGARLTAEEPEERGACFKIFKKLV